MDNVYIYMVSLLIITRAALVYRVLEKVFTFLLFNVRVRDYFIRICSMKLTTKRADRIITFSERLEIVTSRAVEYGLEINRKK